MELSLNEYMSLVEQAPIMIWRANLSTECDYFNRRWLEFTGRTMEQERGNGWAEGVHPEDLDRCVKYYLENFKAQRVFEMEYRLKRHDGEYRWIFDRGVPFYAADGAFAGFIGSCIDVTARVKAEAEIKAMNAAQLQKLEQLLPVCMHCKKVRNDKGYWQSVETYLRESSHTEMTHGLCKECREIHYGKSTSKRP